jgi:NitT/TauT family transport system substrate-binding protein
MISDQQLAVIVYAGAFAEEQPEVAQDFMSAYVCALQDYNDAYAAGGKDLDEIITILAEATGQTPEVLKSTVPVALDPEGALNTDDLERTAQTLAEMGLATKELALEDFVDTSFLDGLTSCDELREMAADQ